MQDIIVTTIASPAASLRELALNRPAKRNALSLPLLEQLLERLSEPEPDQLFLTGRGPVFCSGLDLDECRRVSTWPVRLRHLELLELVYSRLLTSQARTIAFVQGFAVGGGVGLAACADRVIAATNARFRIPQGELFNRARILLPVTAARQVASRQVECWLSGEIDATRALRCGLVDEVLPEREFKNTLAEARVAGVRSTDLARSWRTPATCQRVLTEMQEILGQMS